MWVFPQPGKYNFVVAPKIGYSIDYFNVIVSAKAAQDTELPFHTKCWISTGDSQENFDQKYFKPTVVCSFQLFDHGHAFISKFTTKITVVVLCSKTLAE